MKVKDLIEEIEKCKQEYGDDFLDWDVYTEQLNEDDKKFKMEDKEDKWETIKDYEDWEYFKCFGFWTIMPKEKIFTINVNY